MQDESHSEKGKKVRAVSNAFCIRHFCMEDAYANHVLDLIKQAFNHFPERDFCVVTTSTKSPDIGYIPLLQAKPGKTNWFVNIPFDH